MLQSTLTSESLPDGGFAIARRPDGDYTMALVRCPTSRRLYRASHVLRVCDGAVWVACGWCDQHGRTRLTEGGYDADERQPHCYEIVGDAHDHNRNNGTGDRPRRAG